MPHLKNVLLAVGVLLALQGSGRRVCAECISFAPCEALQQSSVVFVADVVEAAPPAERISDTRSKAVSQPVRFKIIERFKGVPADRHEIAAKIAFSSAETVFVTAGTRYLVYATERPDGTWDTICSRTKPLREVGEELSELRQCRVR